MAWKKYNQMSPEEKKESWSRFRKSSMAKKMQSSHKERPHPSDHEPERNAGGYCVHCGHGRDHS